MVWQGSRGFAVQPMTTQQPYLPLPDVSELWISLDSALWNMNFPKETLGEKQSPLISLTLIGDPHVELTLSQICNLSRCMEQWYKYAGLLKWLFYLFVLLLGF